MEQKKIGQFIQSIRKSRNLTQKQLAEQIGVSDKTISKWENGNSAPDTSMLLPLCRVLDISVNELLSCEKLPPENYSEKAEENMMNLLKNQETADRKSKISIVAGALFGFFTLLLLFISTVGLSPFVLSWFIDLPSLIFLVLICTTVVFVSRAKGKKEILNIIQKTVIPAGVFLSLFSTVIILGNLGNLENGGDWGTIVSNLAVALLTLVYAMLAYVILIPINRSNT